MFSKDKATLEELQWKDIREDFAKVNPDLAAIIDELNPTSKHTIFKARYPFGSEILRDGYLQVPNASGDLLPIYSNHLSNHIKESLGYNAGSNPVSMILKNSAEMFLMLEDRTIPLYGLIPPGKIFGLWRINSSISHCPVFLWGMTAGARSLIMLPKISKTTSHKKLQQKLHITADMPRTLLDQWSIFKEIDSHPDLGAPWFVEILFFSGTWFKSLSSPKWLKFHQYLLQTAWQGSEFWRNQFTWDLVFSVIQQKAKIKSDSYIVNIVKHLIAMAVDAVPGFAPAIDDTAGPVSKIQQIYNDVYNVQYAPIIMQPASFSLLKTNSRPVYYSLQNPSTIEFSPRSREISSKITDLFLVSSLLSKFLAEIEQGKLNLDSTLIYDITQKVNYDFYHTSAANYTRIKHSRELAIEDPTFLSGTSACIGKEFPENSSFICGCVKVSFKNETG